jgi:DNA-binding response OmpR family regulator
MNQGCAGVLVVDDDPELQDLVAMVLEMTQSPGLRAETGLAGLREARAAAAQGRPPCLILLDLMLPDMRGEDVAAGLRDLGAVMVVMSAAADGEPRAAEMGLQFLPKPFEIEDLMAVIREHCQAPRSAR